MEKNNKKADERPLLSLCMIVRNEEEVLERCLRSVADIVDQIVIVDTGSKDRTIDIASSYSSEIYSYSWHGDFSAARNESLRYAKGDWILVLDADDELSESSRWRIRPLIRNTEYDAVGIVVRNIAPPDDVVKYYDDTRYRLFRNHRGFCYEQRVHNQIAGSIFRNGGRAVDSDLVILHHGYKENFQRKAIRSLPMIEAALLEDPENAYMHFKRGETLKALGKNEEALEALKQMFTKDWRKLPPEIVELAFMRLAQIELAFNNYDNVVLYASKCLEINPFNVISRYVMGIALLYQGNILDASALFHHLDQTVTDDYLNKTHLHKLIQITDDMLNNYQMSAGML